MRKIWSSTNAVDRSAYRSRALPSSQPNGFSMTARTNESPSGTLSPALPRLTAIDPNSRGGVEK
jgi:hypothetical protein